MTSSGADIYLPKYNFTVETRTGAGTRNLFHRINCALLFVHQALCGKQKRAIYFLCQAVLRGCLLTCTEFILAVTTGVAKDSLKIKECWQSILVVYCMYFSLSSLKQPSKKPSSLCRMDGVPLSSGLLASGACRRRVCSPIPYGVTSLHLNLPL